MKDFVGILILSFSAQASYALGPITNGDYAGQTICTGPKETFNVDTVLKVEEKSIRTISKSAEGVSTHVKRFTVDANGYFTFTADIGGTGSGYLTSNGLHYDAVFNGASGEDTFLFLNDSLYLISSASAFGSKSKCEGVFKSGL